MHLIKISKFFQKLPYNDTGDSLITSFKMSASNKNFLETKSYFKIAKVTF